MTTSLLPATFDLRTLFQFDTAAPLIFSRFQFWGLFVLVFAVFTLVHRRSLLRTGWLVAVSLFFYWKTSGLFVGLLGFSILFDFLLGKAGGEARTLVRKRLILATSVTINLLLLTYFKYAHFVVENINAMFHTSFEPVNFFAAWANAAWDAHFVENKILLPAGISFYTFQCISYAVDIYRGTVKPVRNLLDFAFYLSFFPKLATGPIMRASELIPQIHKPYELTRVQFGIAVFWILNGLVKKVILGDHVAVNFVDRVFSDPSRFTGFENVMALYGYSLQVYADFSGYTDIAIGVAMLMGFTLSTNFNSPYKARNVADFWRRWHMTLSNWLRDYLYIPMGGNRGGSLFSWIMLAVIGTAVILLTGWWWLPAVYLSAVALFAVLSRYMPGLDRAVTTNLNLLITMLIGGLWHGASWMFVIWGGLNGLGLVVYKWWKKISPWEKSTHWIAHAWVVFLTFSFITFTRIWFRSDSLDTANAVLHQIANNFGLAVAGDVLWAFRSVFLVMLLGMVVHWLPERVKTAYRTRFSQLPLWAMGVACVVVVLLVYQAVTAEMVPFIYFQF
ncbi:MAG TPA: MBOAT family O-acyltransferase [Flavobacteriales bacterium]|nr:MBOAT family O-acyltransferase [Flavobacteriales bacterium]